MLEKVERDVEIQGVFFPEKTVRGRYLRAERASDDGCRGQSDSEWQTRGGQTFVSLKDSESNAHFV